MDYAALVSFMKRKGKIFSLSNSRRQFFFRRQSITNGLPSTPTLGTSLHINVHILLLKYDLSIRGYINWHMDIVKVARVYHLHVC